MDRHEYSIEVHADGCFLTRTGLVLME